MTTAAGLEPELIAAVGAEHVDRVETADAGAELGRVRPGSAAEVAGVIRRAGAHRAAVHPIGAAGRTPRSFGGEARPRVLVSTRRLDQVLQLDELSLLVHAQAGITGLEL